VFINLGNPGIVILLDSFQSTYYLLPVKQFFNHPVFILVVSVFLKFFPLLLLINKAQTELIVALFITLLPVDIYLLIKKGVLLLGTDTLEAKNIPFVPSFKILYSYRLLYILFLIFLNYYFPHTSESTYGLLLIDVFIIIIILHLHKRMLFIEYVIVRRRNLNQDQSAT
jgi:hypothetical protein